MACAVVWVMLRFERSTRRFDLAARGIDKKFDSSNTRVWSLDESHHSLEKKFDDIVRETAALRQSVARMESELERLAKFRTDAQVVMGGLRNDIDEVRGREQENSQALIRTFDVLQDTFGGTLEARLDSVNHSIERMQQTIRGLEALVSPRDEDRPTPESSKLN